MVNDAQGISHPNVSPLLRRLRHLSLVNEFLLLSGIVLLFGALVIGWWINQKSTSKCWITA